MSLERQIRPIYDALDTGSNKSAIVACNKLLKKHPKHELVKALKSLALVRSQKVEEALIICDEVLAVKPTNDAVLTAMMHVLRALSRHNDLISMFEEAYKQQPGNEDLAGQTFFANVRAGHWKVAQQLATKMFKQFNEERYLYWNVTSSILQALDPATPSALCPVLYKLAHRLITSSPTPSYHSGDRFYLHLFVLKELSLFDEAQKLLDSPIGQNICETNLYCEQLRRDLARSAGAWKEEASRSEGLIKNKRDRNWLSFLSILDNTFENSTTGQVDPVITEEIARVQEFLEEVSTLDGSRDRSGPLALLELERRARCHNYSTDSARFMILLDRYFTQFGHKAVCFEDLKAILPVHGHDDHIAWMKYVENVPASSATTAELQRSINARKLTRFGASQSPVAEEHEIAQQHIQHYADALPLGTALASTELQPADDLAILAANVLVNIWDQTKKEEYLYAVTTLLEYALLKSPQSFYMRLVLIRVYRILGAPTVALEHYRSLNIKQIQHDTLSHFLLSRASTFSLAASGDLTFSTECLEATEIYLSNSQETSEFVIRAFMQEKYTQIPHIISFEERLENSLQRDMLKIEHLRMRLTHETITSDIVDMELIELKFIFARQHTDNRDFDVVPNYQPSGGKDLDQQTLMFGLKEDHGWLSTFLKMYIRAFQHGSDLDETVEERLLIGDRPKPATDPSLSRPLKERLLERKDDEMTALTAAELALVAYADALATWLEPHHDHIRPSPAVVLAEAVRQTELKTGHTPKDVEIPAPNEALNGRKAQEPPPIEEAPASIAKFFDDIQAKFDIEKDQASMVEVVHLACILQEAFLLLIVETMRFKPANIVKIHKLGNLVTSIKGIHAKATASMRYISGELVKLSEHAVEVKARDALVDATASIVTSRVDRDHAFNTIKKTVEARKKLAEGVGKGMGRVCQMYKTY